MQRSLVLVSIAAAAFALCVPGIAAAGDVEAGKKAYELNCASCHGMTGMGDGPVAAALNPKPRNFSGAEWKVDADGSGTPGDDEDLTLVIKNGALAYGGSPLMAGWPALSDEDVASIIAYIRTLE